jgi:hypothetical protein
VTILYTTHYLEEAKRVEMVGNEIRFTGGHWGGRMAMIHSNGWWLRVCGESRCTFGERRR